MATLLPVYSRRNLIKVVGFDFIWQSSLTLSLKERLPLTVCSFWVGFSSWIIIFPYLITLVNPQLWVGVSSSKCSKSSPTWWLRPVRTGSLSREGRCTLNLDQDPGSGPCFCFLFLPVGLLSNCPAPDAQTSSKTHACVVLRGSVAMPHSRRAAWRMNGSHWQAWNFLHEIV